MEFVSTVSEKHASEEVRSYCLFMYYFRGLKCMALSKYFDKAPSTITNWIKQFERGDGLSRAENEAVARKFSFQMKEWLVAMYNQNPTIFLKEARQKFMLAFGLSISTSHISVILREAGMSWKCLERRAIQVCYQDVIRFTNELLLVPWLGCNLVFLDEVSFDNRNMLRNKGFGLKGQRLYFRGEYARKPRVSLLAFIGINGLIDTFKVEGTFDRILFATCCKEFATGGFVSQYPGQHSVWILDGASIHRDENITYFLRSLGIIVIFLPAYCPFFNPIEIMFGLVKQKMKKYYETSGLDFKTMIIDVISSFQNTDFTGIFRKCGYSNNCFDPAVGLGQSLQDLDFDLGPEEQ